jgi:hypothetical protein
MSLDSQNIREMLESCFFLSLFVEELGWDNHSGILPISIGSRQLKVRAVAQKHGCTIYHLGDIDEDALSTYPLRRGVATEVAKISDDFLIAFTPTSKTWQVWQWVRREPDRALCIREHHLNNKRSFDEFALRLRNLSFLDEDQESLIIKSITKLPPRKF